MKKENQINELEKKLNEFNLKNKISENEIKKLKDIILNKENEIKIIKDEANKYKVENEILKNENKKLNKDLLKLKEVVNEKHSKNDKIDNTEINKSKDEFLLSTDKLNIKNNEINELKNIKNYKIEESKYNMNDTLVINFISLDSTVDYDIGCSATDVFAEVEEKLYQKYDDLRNTNNMFTVNARPILRFKNLFENQIKNGDTIQLYKIRID